MEEGRGVPSVLAKTMNLTETGQALKILLYIGVSGFLKITTHDWFVHRYVSLYGSHVIWFPFRHPPLDVTSVCLLRKVEEKDILAQHGRQRKLYTPASSEACFGLRPIWWRAAFPDSINSQADVWVRV